MTKFSATYSSSLPLLGVNLISFLAQSISPLCLLSQSIPSITSIPFHSRTMRLAKNSTPLIRMLTIEHTCLASISPLGELTIIQFFSTDNGRLYSHTKLATTNECDAPESNNTIALLSLTRIVPMITSGAAWASSMATWFTRAHTWFCLAEVVVLVLRLGVWFTPWTALGLGCFCGHLLVKCPFCPQLK
jgi:hypothetical protein